MTPRRTRVGLALGLTLAVSSLGAPGVSAQEATMPDAAGTAVEDLLAHVPADHRDHCQPDLTNEDASAVMAVECRLPSGMTVVYTQLKDAAALDARYQRRLEIESIEPDSGDCSTDAPGAGSYTIAGQPAGRYICGEPDGLRSFFWTHDASGIYGQAIDEIDAAEMWSWWLSESGPLTPEPDAEPTGLGDALDALLARVPESHRDGCLPFHGGGPEDGVVVSVKCTVADDLDAYYSRYGSADALRSGHQRAMASAGVEAGVGDCSTSTPGELGYTIGGEPAGRLLCDTFFDSIELRWTHEPTLIGGTVFADRDIADAWDWWLDESGPIPD